MIPRAEKLKLAPFVRLHRRAAHQPRAMTLATFRLIVAGTSDGH